MRSVVYWKIEHPWLDIAMAIVAFLEHNLEMNIVSEI